MSADTTQAKVAELLNGLKQGPEPLNELFWSVLNYDRVNQPLSTRDWTENQKQGITESPLLFASAGSGGDFHVIYNRLESDDLLRTYERPITTKLLSEHPYSLFVFSNADQTMWDFINVKFDEKLEDKISDEDNRVKKRQLFRRIKVGPDERLYTASQRIAMLDLESVSGKDLYGLSPLAIQHVHDKAFDVEKVTNEFFKRYRDEVFIKLQEDLEKQSKDNRWAHDYALQFLNRIMFLYFVQRKRWLGNDIEFLDTLWRAYRKNSKQDNTFFDKWLNILFFEAFNDKFHGGHKHLPKDIREVFQLAPFLNGGLFTENDLDHKHSVNIDDRRIEQVITFFDAYNFTIAEDSPLDQEVAVDPEMIGKVYESLVNLPESGIDERGDVGIFYTPRTEIDLMCRLSLVDNLANHLGNEHKSLLYELIFAFTDEEKQDADNRVQGKNLWPEIDRHLREITVLDPACGSGSFLVGMLTLISDLMKRADAMLGNEETAYERKKRIIGRSLYGVDVMKWAVDVAELRLWLQLVIDTDLGVITESCVWPK